MVQKHRPLESYKIYWNLILFFIIILYVNYFYFILFLEILINES